jgi:hypothetical protein
MPNDVSGPPPQFVSDGARREHIDIILLCLILGGNLALQAINDLVKRSPPGLPPSAALDLSLEHRLTEETGNLIVLYYAARLAVGEPVCQRMRELIVIWYEWQRRRTKKKGRPADTTRDFGVIWGVIEQLIYHPHRQKKVVIADVADKYGMKRSRVYKLMEGVPVEDILAGRSPL